MVALLHPNSLLPALLPSQKRPVAKRHLRLVEATPSTQARLVAWLSPSIALGVTIVFVLLLGIVGLRLAQGTPPAGYELPTTGDSAAIGTTSATPSLQAGDILVTVAAGQNLWDVARSVHPDGDVRALVVALAERNGGSSLRVGQELLIPGHLVG